MLNLYDLPNFRVLHKWLYQFYRNFERTNWRRKLDAVGYN